MPCLSNYKEIKLRTLSWNLSLPLDFSDSSVSLLCLTSLGCTGICLWVMTTCVILQHNRHAVRFQCPCSTQRRTGNHLRLNWQISVGSDSSYIEQQISAALIHRHFHKLFFVTGVTSLTPDLRYTSHQSQGRKFSGFTHPPRAVCPFSSPWDSFISGQVTEMWVTGEVLQVCEWPLNVQDE